jgi:tRNA1Val (adenine37-N6)-methyltransferase
VSATRDVLLRGRLELWQPARGARVTMDPLLLAHFAWDGRARLGQVLDLGTGTGVMALVLARCDARARVTGLELHEPLVELARRSAAEAGLDPRVELVCADLRTARPGTGFDLVVANPPYTPVGRGRRPPERTRASAREEGDAALPDVIAAAARALAPKGRLCLVLPAGRLGELVLALGARKLHLRRLRAVHSHQGEPARRVLVEAGRGHDGALSLLPPLVVHAADRRAFSAEATDILDGGWLPG